MQVDDIAFLIQNHGALDTVDTVKNINDNATFLPSLLLRIWLNTVVLPAPRKPESTVTGNLLSIIQLTFLLPTLNAQHP